MNVFGELLTWLTSSEQWDADGIPRHLLDHVWLSGLSVGIAAIPALVAGISIGHTRRFEFITVSVANLGRAVPSFAILALALPISIRMGLGLGFWPTFAALFFLAIPPMLTNTYVGVREVDADTVEAARGVGMTGGEILRQVELPLAAPLIVAGIRTAAVQVVATATLGALVGWGGLGEYIVFGFATSSEGDTLGGALLVALLAIGTEVVLGFVERRVTPGRVPRRVLVASDSTQLVTT